MSAMPDKLKQFLQYLSEDDWDEILEFLDGDPDAIHKMVSQREA